MSYVICKEPGIQIDLMVKKKYHAQLASYVDRMGCTYKKEVTRIIKGLDEEWVTLKDVASKDGRGVGQLLGLYYSMDWQGLTEGKEDKFYILIHKVRGKKYGRKNRKKVDSGSKGRTAERPAEVIRHGECVGSDRGNPDGGADRDGDIRSEQAE